MEALKIISENPFVTFFIVYIAASSTLKAWKLFMRHLNICKHGWPPPHCDADGDFNPNDGDDEPA